VEFRILGPLQVLDGGTPVEIAGAKRRAMLALLVLHANEVVRTERLIDELWGEHAPRNAAAALHSHVSRLRKALGPEVLARREWGYVLRTDPDSIDLHRFERLLAAAEPLPARERSAKLAEALQLWRGPALSDLANEPGLQTEIARLDELRLTTLERRIDADLEAGRNAELVGEIEALIVAHPLREHLRWQLILALYRAGRQAEALEVYRETRRVLTEELGLEPSPELRELEKAILRQDPAIAAAVPLPPAAAKPTRRARRRGVLLALLPLALVGLGVATAYAIAGRGGSHRAAHATPVAVTNSAPSVATTATPTRTRPRRHIVSQAQRSRQSSRPERHPSSRQPTTQVGNAAPPSAGAPAHLTVTNESTSPATATRTPTRKPRIVTISDNFSGNQIDATIWYQIHQGSGWKLSQHDGHLEFAFPPGTAPGGQWDNYGGHVGTLCKFPHDFDARVDFALVQWPTTNYVLASLWAFGDNLGWETFRDSSPQWGERYGAYLGQGHGGSVSLDDASGTLRLARRNGLITGYFLHKGKWISLGSAYNTRTAAIAVGAGSGQNPPTRHDPVVVDFNNFSITGANPICPRGAQGSS
jgi:DNA-binding SARP family transcriptional activator